jgi:hypothetical protein
MFADFGAGCGVESGTGAAGVFAAPGQNVGPFVPAGTYNVALVVDGKTADTKPLRVTDDPEVVLTSAERRKMFDMAMELHAIQPSLSAAASAHASLMRQMNTLAPTLADRSDVPADVKSSFDALKTELTSMAPKYAVPAGRGGGFGGRGADNSLVVRLNQAKSGLMASMPATDQTMKGYAEAKAQAPKAVADINAEIAKASTLSAALAKYNVVLNVPQPVKVPEPATPRRTSSTGQR